MRAHFKTKPTKALRDWKRILPERKSHLQVGNWVLCILPNSLAQTCDNCRDWRSHRRDRIERQSANGLYSPLPVAASRLAPQSSASCNVKFRHENHDIFPVNSDLQDWERQ